MYGVWGLIARRLPVPGRHEVWLSPLIGYLTGMVTAATGVFVIPAVPYLQCLALKKDDLVRALGLAFTVSTLGLALSLAQGGGLPALNLSLSLLAPWCSASGGLMPVCRVSVRQIPEGSPAVR